MALHLVGLGLHDVEDVTVKGLRAIQAADEVYAEFYTAMLAGTTDEALREFLGKDVQQLDRAGLERGAGDLIARAAQCELAILTAGDPLTATTHTDLLIRCKQAGVPVRIYHAPSIFSAAPGLVGLQHYKFGRTTTLVRPEDKWVPTSPFDAVQENHELGLHTLVLLDIKADETYFMRGNEGLELLLQLAEKVGANWFGPSSQAAVVARAGSMDPLVVTGTVAELLTIDFGAPLHCIVLPGTLQIVEEEAWQLARASA